MGLFDPPSVKMQKYAPVSAQTFLAAVQIYAEDNVPPDLSFTQRSMLVAMVMGGWISTNAQVGTFDMPQRDLDKVKILYTNCAKMLGNRAAEVAPIMRGLCDKELLPEAVREFYSR